MKERIKISESIGLTVASFVVTEDRMFITFTNGKYVKVRFIGADYYWEEDVDFYYDSKAMIESGIATAEEVSEFMASQKKELDEEHERHERETYEALKKKFEKKGE